MGGSPDIVAGLYIGFDQPRNLGGYVQGGNTAAPIFKEFVEASRDRWVDRPFLAPEGVRMVRVDRRTGRRVFDASPTDEPLSAVIWEAFKPDTEPPRRQRRDEIGQMRDYILAQLRQQRNVAGGTGSQRRTEDQTNFAEEQGGLY